RVAPDQIGDRDHESGRTESTLDGTGLDERLLDRMQLVAGRGQTLHCHHAGPHRLRRRDEAGAHREVVEQHRAGATLALLAGVLRAGQTDPFPEQEQQALARPYAIGDPIGPVDGQVHPHRIPPRAAPVSSAHAQRSARPASTASAWRRYAAVPRTSSIGSAAAATRSPNFVTRSSSRVAPEDHGRLPVSQSSAAPARRGVGAADPIAAPTRCRAGSSAIATVQTAITIALRVPTLANCCGPAATGTRTARMSSSGARAFRLTPTKKSSIGISRLPRTDSASTVAPVASNGGWASPAGEAVPRFPAIVARFRICGEPTVRDATASAGHMPASSAMTRL